MVMVSPAPAPLMLRFLRKRTCCFGSTVLME
jgi:hypothetical protein